MLNYTVAKEDDVSIVFLSGRLNASNSEELTEVLLSLPEGRIVLDFAELYYLTSDGLKSLLAWLEATKDVSHRRSLAICSMQAFVRRVFEVTGFENKFPVFEDLDAAMRHA